MTEWIDITLVLESKLIDLLLDVANAMGAMDSTRQMALECLREVIICARQISSIR